MAVSLFPRAALLALTGALALAPSAHAGTSDDTTRTTITSPGDPYFDVYDRRLEEQSEYPDADDDFVADGNELTIRGTADGDDELGIHCFYGSYGGGGRDWYEVGYVSAEDIEGGANAYTWEAEVDKEDLAIYENYELGDQACTLRAVPSDLDEDETDLVPFEGPRVGMGHVDDFRESDFVNRGRGGGSTGRVYDYEVGLPQLGGFFSYGTAGEGIQASSPFAPSTFAQGDYASWYDGGAFFDDGFQSDRASLLVDGEDGFVEDELPSQECTDTDQSDADTDPDDCDADQTGEPTVSFGVTRNATTGDSVVSEQQDVVRCLDDDFENGDDTCLELGPTGVRLERTWTQDRNGRVTTLRDAFVSKDGDGHTVDGQYHNGVDFYDAAWKTPGSDSYAAYYDDDTVELPADEVGTFYARDPYYNDDQSETGSPVSFTYLQRPDRAFFDDEYGLVTQYARSVPAGGRAELSQVYGHAISTSAVEALGASIEDRAGGAPVVDIVTPGNGSETASPRITVTGTAADNVVVDLLKVNGKSVPVASDGSWSTELDLAEGANTITAEARDGEGQAATDAVTVTYRKPAAATTTTTVVAPEAPAPPRNLAGRGKSAVNLRSKRVRVRGDEFVLRVTCAPGSAQNGTIRVRGRLKGKRRNLGTEAYQCPGGGTRSVDFLLSRREERMLRRTKGRRLRMTAYIVGRDLAGDAGTFRQQFTLLPPR